MKNKKSLEELENESYMWSLILDASPFISIALGCFIMFFIRNSLL